MKNSFFPTNLSIMSMPSINRFEVERIKFVMSYIDKNYREKLRIEHLALEAGLSKDKLQAGFQKIVGMTCHAYIMKVRIEKAKILLIETDQPIRSVALNVGFRKAGHFANVFKKLTSMEPSVYRSENSP